MRIRYLLLNAHGTGGTVRTTLSMASALAARGHDVEVASLRGSAGSVQYPLDPRVRVVHLTGTRPRAGAVGSPASVARWAGTVALRRTRSRLAHPRDVRCRNLTLAHDLALRRYLAAQRDAVVIATRLSLNLALARLRRPDQVALAQEHNSLTAQADTRSDYAALYPFLDAVAVLTDRDARAYAELLAGTCPILVVPNALPHGTSRHRAPLTAPVATAAGMLVRRKGFDVLVDAWRLVAAAHPQWRLRIHGTGDQRADLLSRVHRHGLEGSVSLEGFEPDLTSRLHESSLFVLSSRREGLPMVLLEAMAAGLPIVSTDCVTGPAELLEHGRCGVLVPPGDPKALAEAVCRVIEDEALRRSLADAAWRRAGDFDPAQRALEWEQHFARLGDARGLALGR